MEGDTDINAAYDIRNKIHDYMIYNYDDVDVFNKFMVSNVGKIRMRQHWADWQVCSVRSSRDIRI